MDVEEQSKKASSIAVIANGSMGKVTLKQQKKIYVSNENNSSVRYSIASQTR